MSVRLAKRLVEPTFWTCPHGVRQRPESVLTYGPEVADLNAAAGFEPDAQQELGLDLIFAIRPDGSPASFEVCVICCRQNLKTGLFKQAVIGWLFVLDVPLCVWSAHEMSTTNEAQRDLANLMRDAPVLRKRMMRNDNDGVYNANGEERIELATGQRVLFKARTTHGGRGLAAPKLVLDEAFALKAAMMGALLPLMMAQVHPQVLYGSSAGKADSEVLTDIRDRGRRGLSPRLTYLEWLAEREVCRLKDCTHPKDAMVRGLDCALDRERLILAGNPTISTGRITLETVRDLRQALPPEEYARECLGWWDDPDAGKLPLVAPDVWAALEALPGDRPEDGTRPAGMGVDVSHDGALCITGCWYTDLGVYAELLVVDETSGRLDTVDDPDADLALDPAVVWLKARAGRRVPVVVDAESKAAALVPALRAAHVRVIVTGPQDMGKACAGWERDTLGGRFFHAGQQVLTDAFLDARKRPIRDAGGWGLDRKDPAAFIAPAVSAVLARFGAVTGGKPKGTGRAGGTERQVSNGRRAVVMS